MMLSTPFAAILSRAGFLTPKGPAAGMIVAGERPSPASMPNRFDFIFDRRRFPLKVDGLFRSAGTPIIVFIDATEHEPSKADLLQWHGLAWNFGLAPLLWVTTDRRVILFNSYAPPQPSLDRLRIAEFDLRVDGEIRRLSTVCGRLAFDTGAFWVSEFARPITRRDRVDAVLLRELAALENGLITSGLEPLLAQKLIGRAIFSRYLVDRGLLPSSLLEQLFGRRGLTELMRDRGTAHQLFDWMKLTFNGDLFPPDVPGERALVEQQHLGLIADFLGGLEVSSGQWRMFPFRFDVIPVELISSIYEQFAHSIAGSDAAAQGLHYTPINLVDLTLDHAFSEADADVRVLDPACGSGVFLVEAMRRIVFLRTQREPCTRALVRDVLHNQLFGIDINAGALQVTAFSLYLAALELDPELPDGSLDWLRFDHLIGRTLHLKSFFEAKAFGNRRFDVIIGNPPWTYSRGGHGARRAAPSHDHVIQPSRTPDWAFLWRARELAVPGARIGLLMKATPFFSKDRVACEARRLLLSSFSEIRLINMSQLRGEDLFPAVQSRRPASQTRGKATTGPAILFTGRVAPALDGEQVHMTNVPWVAGFRHHGVLEIVPELCKVIPLDSVRSDQVLFKAAMFGNAREFGVMQELRLSNRLVPLRAWCDHYGISMDQGLQIGGGSDGDASALRDLPFLDAGSYRAGRVPNDLPAFRHDSVHRPRNRDIYRGPLVLCPESGFGRALQAGRYSAAISERDVAYTDSFVGISLNGQDPRIASVLSIIFHSKLSAFQLTFGGSNIGLKQPKIEKMDLEALMIPDFMQLGERLLQRAAKLGRQLGPNSGPATLRQVDELVMDMYGLSSFDSRIVDDVLIRSRPLFIDTREERLRSVARVDEHQLFRYGTELTHWLDTLLRDAGSFRAVLSRAVRLGPDVVALRFDIEEGALKPVAPFAIKSPELFEVNPLMEALGGDTLPNFQARRFMRLYDDRAIYIIKPDERRYWCISDAQADVQLILDDQLLRIKQGHGQPIPPLGETKWKAVASVH